MKTKKKKKLIKGNKVNSYLGQIYSWSTTSKTEPCQNTVKIKGASILKISFVLMLHWQNTMYLNSLVMLFEYRTFALTIIYEK